MNREVKNSGIEWIGEIPYSWQIKSVKNEFTRKQSQSSNLENNILTLARSGVKVRDISTGEGQIASDYSKYNYVTPGDLLLNPMDLVSGDNCNISNIYGVISPAYFNLGVKNHANPYFFNYYFKMQYWVGSFFAHGKGVSFENRWTLNYETLRNFPILFPPLNEQQKIVKFLDDNLSYINSLTEQTYQSINELKKYKQLLITEAVTKGFDSTVEMKDSGIEWIGKIPKHWQTIKMKYLLSTPLLYGANESGIPYQEDLPRYIRITDILNNNKLSDNNKLSLSLEKAKSFFLKENDILFARSGASVGKTFLISKENVNDTFAGYLIKASFKDNVNAKYIFLFTQSSAFENWKNAITIQSTIQNIGANRYNNLIISLPTYEEQQQIVQYLDNKTSAIDNIIADKTKIIEELENYKKSLIYEYVTGKKEV
ncbi:restriction endonuclease subunit S [Staphylococcus xylosus]|uniref:Type I restriction modification DNA specificity domain-containing protein n=3 Tax=Staphylococcus TaxID=1279 RepID=A0AAQ0LYG7_STAXY|nr:MULTISPECIES: restriction endonuclease subunit S [Staphylococcus]PTJ63693.1 hypothetical protein BUZ76_10525 [Staphylococcus saprophyticus]RIM92408.1 hypothetical protein BU104_07140 [Staphylococcus xylosus]